METPNLNGKRILLTQNSLQHIAGSEVVTLELAKYFQEHNAKVAVYTWALENPIKKEFEKEDIKVTTDDYDPDVILPDIVWVHHQVLPLGLIKSIQENKTTPQLFFYHMSAYDTLYLEQPYIYNLEKKFAARSLFVSKETMQLNVKKYGQAFIKPTVFPNFFPDQYVKTERATSSPHKILIVSNHPPREIELAKNKFIKHGYEVSSLGCNGSSYQVISPNLLEKYDTVITIGKTVQYCLAMDIPVYIYDIFGGCGYLNSKNYEKAKFANFSGRGFSKKNPEDIFNEITKHFKNAQSFQTKNHKSFIEEFSLSKNLPKILSTKAHTIKIDNHFFNYLIAAENLAKCAVLVEQNQNLTMQIQNLNQRLNEKEQLLSSKNQIIQNMENSRAVKIAKKIHSISSFLANKAPQDPLKPYRKNYKTIVLQKKLSNKKYNIVGLIREKNESLILEDTLSELEKIVDGFILLDDNSNDNSITIAKKHPKCIAIIKNLKTVNGDRSMEESIHRELLLELARNYNPKWIFYQDADERIEDPVTVRKYMLKSINDPLIEAISFSFFDAYMTKNDSKPYQYGPLFNFRKFFGPERRDIIMAWKPNPDITFMARPDLRVPDGIDPSKTITKFYVQHYGKAISTEQWEETCDYYIKHFPQYAKKWQTRKGKSIHDGKSDFNRPLITWKSAKRNGGTKIN